MNINTQSATTTNRLITTEEVAALLGVNCDTVRRYANSGIIPSFRFGKDWRFDANAVLSAAAFNAKDTENV